MAPERGRVTVVLEVTGRRLVVILRARPLAVTVEGQSDHNPVCF